MLQFIAHNLFIIINRILILIPEFSHQSHEMIVGLSTHQDQDSAYYTFNVWNPAKNLLQTIHWNSDTGMKLVKILSMSDVPKPWTKL
jgi:hypothetical protein